MKKCCTLFDEKFKRKFFDQKFLTLSYIWWAKIFNCGHSFCTYTASIFWSKNFLFNSSSKVCCIFSTYVQLSIAPQLNFFPNNSFHFLRFCQFIRTSKKTFCIYIYIYIYTYIYIYIYKTCQTQNKQVIFSPEKTKFGSFFIHKYRILTLE